MERKKVRLGFTAIDILSAVFTALGGGFLLLGVCLLIFSRQWVLALPFLTVGPVFLLVGIPFFLRSHQKRKGAQQALDEGRYFFAEIVDVQMDYSVRVNGRCPSYVVAQMTDPYGKVHVFKSRNFQKTAVPDFIGQQVKVYAVQGDLSCYYMDIDPLLSQVVEH